MSELISYGFLTPPAVLIVLCLVGGLLALVWRGFGVAVVILSAAALYGLAVPVAWNEDRSLTTRENALFTARLLRAEGIATVVLVSHAWHLPRGLWAFERVGLQPLPWPAPRSVVRLRRIDDFLPSIAALHDSFYALHEMFGGVYYRLRY